MVDSWKFSVSFEGPKKELSSGEKEGSKGTFQCSEGPHCCHYVQLVKGAPELNNFLCKLSFGVFLGHSVNYSFFPRFVGL